MIEAIRTVMATTARLLVALMLLQCIFVAAESCTDLTPRAVDHRHGELAAAVDQHGAEHAAAPAAGDGRVDAGNHLADNHRTDSHRTDSHANSCDYCCQCQGHGSHLALPTSRFALPAHATGDTPPLDLHLPLLSRTASIDRPPIV